MKSHLHKSITLLELLIAIALVSVIILGLSSIDLFSRFHVLTADRRAKLQNEVSYVLEHMSKEIGKAIGDAIYPAVTITSIGTNPAIVVWIDDNQNGRRDSSDIQIAYSYQGSPDYQMRYYPNYSGSPGSYQILGQKISGFERSLTDNYVYIKLTACWDPDGTPYACGTPDNPDVTMSNHIKMPSVSTH